METSNDDDDSDLTPKEMLLKFFMEIAKDFAFINKTSLTKIQEFSNKLCIENDNCKFEKVAISITNLMKKNLINTMDVFCNLADRMKVQNADSEQIQSHVSACKMYILKKIVEKCEEEIKQLLETREKDVKDETGDVKDEANSEISAGNVAEQSAVNTKGKSKPALSLIKNEVAEESSDEIPLGSSAISRENLANKAASSNNEQQLDKVSSRTKEKNKFCRNESSKTINSIFSILNIISSLAEADENDDTTSIKAELRMTRSATTDTNPETICSFQNSAPTNTRETDSPDSDQSLVFDINNITYEKMSFQFKSDHSSSENEETDLNAEETNSIVAETDFVIKSNIDSNNDANVEKENNVENDVDSSDGLHINANTEQEKHELLCLLREVKLPQSGDINDGEVSSKNVYVPKVTKKREKELLELVKKWMAKEDSLSETSDDVSDVSLSIFNESDKENEKQEEDEEIEIKIECPLSDERVKDLKEKYEIKNLKILLIDCIKYGKNYDDNVPKTSRKRTLSDEVDQLCNLDFLKKPRISAPTKELIKVYKKKRSIQKESATGTDSDSETETTLSNFSESEDEVLKESSVVDERKDEPLDQNELLAKSLCNNIRDSSSESDFEMSDFDISNISDCSSSKSGKEGKRKKNYGNITRTDKRNLTEEEKARKKWRKDPLLCGRLDESDSSSDESVIRTRRKNNFSIIKSSSDSEPTNRNKPSSSSPTNENNNKSENINKSNSKSFNFSKLSGSSDSDSSSDVEFVSPEKKIDSIDISDDENIGTVSKKGRRNIRALLSEEFLTESTQRARSEEMERISRLENISKELESQSSVTDPDCLILDPNPPQVKVHAKLTNILKPHQKEGILFMWLSCFESLEQMKKDPGSGCILAHCMGLGKTLQVIVLLHTLFKDRHIAMKHAVVVCPLSTVQNWKKEFNKAFKVFAQYPLNVHTIGNRKEILHKVEIIRKWHEKGGTLIVSYETFQSLVTESKREKYPEMTKKYLLEALIDPGPELIVCDEGHLIRNEKSLRAKILNRVKTKRRIILTGTPLQNNLLEYYQMVQFVKPDLLGNTREFRTNFVNPITNGQYDDSTPGDIKYMKRRTHVLHQLLKNTVQRYENTELAQYLPKMIDYAVFVNLSALQKILYRRYMEIATSQGNNAQIQRKQFFKDYRTICAICSHPYTMQKIEARKKNPQTRKVKEKDVINLDPDEVDEQNVENEWWKTLMYSDIEKRIEYSYKFVVMKCIIEEAEAIGDKVLLFSQSLAEMDAIEHFLNNHGTARCQKWLPKVDYCRMDGTVLPEERTIMCDSFNDKRNWRLRLFIMSHKVGGLGLNLVAANRIILMGVNFNPSYDTQSIYRAYRFGQQKIVCIYRLIAMGSMEEKVYHRCVTKLAISSRVIDKHQITRHYKSIELQEMYKYDFSSIENPLFSVPEDILLGRILYRMNCIVKYHEHQGLLQNRPDECLDEEEKVAAWEEFNRINQPAPQEENQQNQPALQEDNQQEVENALQLYNADESHILDLTSNVPVNLENNSVANRDPLEIDNDLFLASACNFMTSNLNNPDNEQNLNRQILEDMSLNFNFKNKQIDVSLVNTSVVQNGLVVDENDVIISETASEVASTQSSLVIPNLNGNHSNISNTDVITID